MYLIALFSFPGYILLHELLMALVGIRHPKQHRTLSEHRELKYMRVVALVVYILGVIATSHKTYGDHMDVRLIGLGMIVFGLFLGAWAKATLGRRSWSNGIGTNADHQLVTRGPYRAVQHPMYLGMLIAGFGIGLCSLNLSFLAAGLLWAGSYLGRIKLETGALDERFRVSYQMYRRKTGALWPNPMKG